MNITVYDLVLLGIVALGIWEGRKKGFYKMITPFISFAVSIMLMKWVSMFIMNIFGDSLIVFFAERIDSIIAQVSVNSVDIEDIKYDFVVKFVQGIVFVISYITINVVVTVVLNKVKRLSNNMILYRIDQILGCVFGGLSNVFTVMLVITVIQVLYDMNVTEIITLVNTLKKSEVISWMIENNYIYKFFLSM